MPCSSNSLARSGALSTTPPSINWNIIRIAPIHSSCAIFLDAFLRLCRCFAELFVKCLLLSPSNALWINSPNQLIVALSGTDWVEFLWLCSSDLWPRPGTSPTISSSAHYFCSAYWSGQWFYLRFWWACFRTRWLRPTVSGTEWPCHWDL